MRTLNRLLMAGTFLSGAAWLPAAQAATLAAEGVGLNGEHATHAAIAADQTSIILAQAPPAPPATEPAPPPKPAAPPPPKPPAPPPPKPPAPPPPPAARPAPPPPPPPAAR